MNNVTTHNHRSNKSMVFKPYQQELDKPPRQFSDYMTEENNRFCEICKLYLDGMSLDDIKYLKPEDFINLVPPDHFKHRLLMTIMVRRYLFRHDAHDHCNPNDNDKDGRDYKCDNCDHVCTNPDCTHSCKENNHNNSYKREFDRYRRD